MTIRFAALHGFTQTHTHWHRPAAAIHRELVERAAPPPQWRFIDAPGHGLSSAPTTFAADALAAGMLGRDRTMIGYSMGGRLALAAAANGARFERLVLVGATAGIEKPGDAAERRSLDEQRAEAIARDGVRTFVDDWVRMPMFAGLAHQGLTHRYRNSAEGLAASLRLHGVGAQPSVWHLLDRVELPVLYLVGERDHKFGAIGEELVGRLPNARLDVVPDAGHACHLEQPDATARLLVDWLVS